MSQCGPAAFGATGEVKGCLPEQVIAGYRMVRDRQRRLRAQTLL
jgi:hypothetical protein